MTARARPSDGLCRGPVRRPDAVQGQRDRGPGRHRADQVAGPAVAAHRDDAVGHRGAQRPGVGGEADRGRPAVRSAAPRRRPSALRRSRCRPAPAGSARPRPSTPAPRTGPARRRRTAARRGPAARSRSPSGRTPGRAAAAAPASRRASAAAPCAPGRRAAGTSVSSRPSTATTTWRPRTVPCSVRTCPVPTDATPGVLVQPGPCRPARRERDRAHGRVGRARRRAGTARGPSGPS